MDAGRCGVIALWLSAAVAAEPVVLDAGCQELATWLSGQVPVVRRGRVKVSACARVPGVQAVVVLAAARGDDGEVLSLVGGSDGLRLSVLRDGWTSEPLLLLARARDDDSLLRAVMAPLRLGEIVRRPEFGVADVRVEPGDALPNEADRWTVAERLLGIGLRPRRAADWSSLEASAVDELLDELPVAEQAAGELVKSGVLSAADVALAPAVVLKRAVGDDAQALADAAAMWVEWSSSLPARRRGW